MTTRLSAIAVLLVASTFASADERAERARIKREREQVNAEIQRDEAACATRFAVTGCVEDVRKRRREALRSLREQELVLEDRERREKAAAAMQRIERKRIESETREQATHGAQIPGASASAASAAATRAAAANATAASARADARTHARDDQAAQAAARASAAERRRSEAAADRARIQSRIERRAAEAKKNKPVAPLPPALAASR